MKYVIIFFERMRLRMKKLLISNIDNYIYYLVDDQKLNLQDLYALKETEILKILEQYSSWNTFCNLEKIERSNEKPDGYYVNVSAKKRYTNPLCGNSRITDLSNDCKILLDKYMNFEDSKYAYSKKIKNL